MKKRYKIVLNLDITDPEEPFPAGGDSTHLSRLEGIVHALVTVWVGPHAKITLDKVIDKGVIAEKTLDA